MNINEIKKRIEELEAANPVWERLTLDDRFERAAEKYSERPYIITEDKIYTYRQTMEMVNRIARGLIAAGVKPRDHIAVLMGNRPEYAFFTYAISKVGAVKVPVNLKLNMQDLAYTLRQSDTKFLITVQGGTVSTHEHIARKNVILKLFGNLLRDGSSEDFPLLKKIIIFSDDWETDIEGCVSFREFLKAGEAVSDETVRQRDKEASYPDDIAEIMYTSGCTGSPKGVMISHDMLWRNIYQGALLRAFQDGRRIFIPIPLYHMFGYKGLLGVLFVGGCAITQIRFNTLKALELISRGKAQDILCVPQVLAQIVGHPDRKKYDLSSVKSLVCSAAPVPVDAWRQLRDELKIEELSTSYGMTELCGGTVYSEFGVPLETLATRVGKNMPSGCCGMPEYGWHLTQYKVVDPATGEDLPEGSEGELTCRGPVVTKGYYKKPLETAEVIDKDGWMRSGDIGKIHADGYIELIGRCKEMYKTNGENVAPREIEILLERHPCVKTCAVVGVSDKQRFEVGAAFIELKKGSECTEGEILAYCGRKLAAFKVPKYVRFIRGDEFPRTGSMKIRKFMLRERFENEMNQKG